MFRRNLLSSFLLLSMTGCSIFPERPPLKYYGLVIDVPSKQNSIKQLNASLVINPPVIASPFDSSKFFILGNDERFYASDENRFVSQPAELIGNSLRLWLEAYGPWDTILSPNSISSADYQMTIYLQSFYSDVREGRNNAVINMEVSVIKNSSNKLIFHHIYKEQTPIKEKTPTALVVSFREGLTKIFQDLTNSLDKTILSR